MDKKEPNITPCFKKGDAFVEIQSNSSTCVITVRMVGVHL